VTTRAANFKDNEFLLVHGTGDDNVHWQQTAELAFELIQSGVQFQTMFYPNKDHSINGNNARQHLYKTLSSFIQAKVSNS
jgi:dipeptidyl-peptidase-4